ncbi:hypothetical protein AB0E78_30780 [Streptomyces sp. NPDC032198]|uniref:hypothetical protein n=1 Tax=Streptomyces sp. NPDC032198 TaxID=3155127 RepID=UPI0033E494BE
MSNSRVIRTVLVSSVLGLGAVTGLASAAVAAPAPAGSAPSQPATSASASAGPSSSNGSQDMHLSDGSVAHVTDLGGGKWKAQVTRNGHTVANLDSTHSSSRLHGYTYALNQANGFVGVTEPSGWHSESDAPRPVIHHKTTPVHHDFGTPVHHKSTPVNRTHRQDQQRPQRVLHEQRSNQAQAPSAQRTAKPAGVATRDLTLPGGAIAHITELRSGQWEASITLHNVQIVQLNTTHPTAHTHGYTYTLNTHNGTVTARK